MATAVVTGSGGLIGSETVRFLIERGFDVIGIENDMRSRFFGQAASTEPITQTLLTDLDEFRLQRVDIRDREAVESIFAKAGAAIELVVHTAAQPSHDWAASDPQTDFTVNANGTLNLLEATRANCPDATFVFMSTNKVYGDRPNDLPLENLETRYELPSDHRWFNGIDTDMSIDSCTHSLFGVSKAAADLAVQEYGRYFGMPTVCFRGGCLTGPQHAGAKLHGFLAYLMRCTVTGDDYTVYGYEGKQVRDNIHAHDVSRAIEAFHAAPSAGAVYNLGGGRGNSISMLEAIALCERVSGRELSWSMGEEPRVGDHMWWITDLDRFRADYPSWDLEIDLERIARELYEHNVERWTAEAS
jgi:CDP-paratose 2-epimerase